MINQLVDQDMESIVKDNLSTHLSNEYDFLQSNQLIMMNYIVLLLIVRQI